MSINAAFRDYLDTLPVLDGHEHLSYPADQGRGFFDILHYAQSDLLSAGMPGGLDTAGLGVRQRAETFERYYAKAGNTAYFRAVRRFAADLYGVEQLGGGALLRLDAMVKENGTQAQAWYQEVLGNRCRIKAALTMHDGSQTRHPILKPALYLDFLLRRSQIRFLAQQLGHAPSFGDYLDYVDRWLGSQLDGGAVAGKFGTPYWRDMDFIPADQEAAAQAFAEDHERSPSLEGYLFHRILAVFEARGIPIQFHTGHVEPQSANMGDYRTEWSDPSPFAHLGARYPRLKLVLLHTGFPYSDSYFSLVKNVPNLYADFSWIYVISPLLAERNLHLAIETVPLSKVIGFGGDAQSVELVYGHLCAAKEVIARVFAQRVGQGWFSRDEAQSHMAALLYGNAADIYALAGQREEEP